MAKKVSGHWSFLRRLCIVVLPFLFVSGCDQSSAAYPNRAIVLICPWAAGGGTDRIARLAAEGLEKELGQPVVVQNQTGGSGAVGHFGGARSRPDGYTITMGTFELSTMRSMGIAQLDYEHYLPLMQLNGDPAAIFVRSDSPYKTLGELLEAAKANPGKLRMSGTGAGGVWDLARAGMLMAAGMKPDAIMWVPSQGSAPSIVELLGGHIDAVCCSLPEALSQLDAGQLRALCVMAPARDAQHAEIPTAREQGIDWNASVWRGLLLPPRTPDAVVQRLTEALGKVVVSDHFTSFMKQTGFGVVIRRPTEFQTFLADQDAQWAKVVQSAGMGGGGISGPHDPGPWFIPGLLATILVVGSLGVGIKTAIAGCSQSIVAPLQAAGGMRDVLILVASLPIYLLSIDWIGFFIATFIYATLLMIRLGTRVLPAILLSAVLLLGIRGLFVNMFRLVLPAAPWGLPF